MKILLQEDEKTRIVQGGYLRGLGYIVRRQKKRWWGWKTVEWLLDIERTFIENKKGKEQKIRIRSSITTIIAILSMLTVASIIFYRLYSGYIDQTVDTCLNERNFCIYTVAWNNNQIVYSSNTFLNSNCKCLDIEKVDSAKKAEYQKAARFLELYNKVK